MITLEKAIAALEAIRDYKGPKWPDEMTLTEKIMQQCAKVGLTIPKEYDWLRDE
jgi:hypothetical protein